MAKKILRVKDVMAKKVVSLPLEITIKQAAQILIKRGYSGAPVVDLKGKLCGVISEKDLFKALYPSYKELHDEESLASFLDPESMQERIQDKGNLTLKDILKREPICTDPEEPLVKIGAMLMARGINRIPVVAKGKLVGLISREDVYREVFKQIFEF